LIEQGVQHAFASYIRPGPLETAKETTRAAGLEHCITPMIRPGLEAFGPEDADAIVIC
jgi:tRNA A22 N-methylase